MNHILAVFKKELRSYFYSPIAYIVIIVFLIVSSWLFVRGFFFFGQAAMRDYFVLLPWIFLFLIPAVTMRIWSEEKRQGTIEVLLTFPVKDYEVVIGKFLASLVFVIITLAFSLGIPLVINKIGDPDWGVIGASYLGAVLLAGAYLAIGLWVSSFTNNQIIAFVISIAICFALFIIGENFVLITLPSWLGGIARFLGLGEHFRSIGRGVIDSRDIIYYLSVIGFFLFMNVRQVESRRWK